MSTANRVDASTKSKSFAKVLVANRGEIAVRVIRALRDAGIGSVAVVSEADRGALHARLADEVVEVGPAPAVESYLRADRILDAARKTEADAVHPGYGFLAENESFARACDEAGIVFIGPPVAAIESMGDKARAREIAVAAGVPVVPGRERVADDADLLAAAKEIGFPLIIKPSAGGGGKGMKTVTEIDHLVEEAAAARREAKASFGNDTLILERLVRPARHIEIQVFADAEHVVAIGERECSLQRRHQKIIEESPSPAIDEALRTRMQDSACALARRVGYLGAGTVEFLVDTAGEFYFLEMNTRLQVEHPVTELVYDVDLVRAQLDVAQGRGMPAAFRELRARGWALEARLYAEDAARDFMPAPGRLHVLAAPTGPGVRFDTGVVAPGEISAEYDPMIAKLIVHGADRVQAVDRLRRALQETVVLGVTTNIGFLLDVVAQDWFVAGEFDTGTVEAKIDELRQRPEPDDAVIAAVAWAMTRRRSRSSGAVDDEAASTGDRFSPFDSTGEWRLFTSEAGR